MAGVVCVNERGMCTPKHRFGLDTELQVHLVPLIPRHSLWMSGFTPPVVYSRHAWEPPAKNASFPGCVVRTAGENGTSGLCVCLANTATH